ncbi:SpoIIE family protein phosphatase [bacterium]|nr:SpoIIE family protein phosphatase [candidate division CSSED10-310 bacterium]
MNSDHTHELHHDRLMFLLRALEDMGSTLTGGESFDSAARYLLRMLLGSVGISSGAIYTFQSGQKMLKLKDKTSAPECIMPDIPVSDDLIARFTGNPSPIPVSAIPESTRNMLGYTSAKTEANNIQVLIPLAVKNDLLGMVCLGRRFLNQPYSDMDLEILGLLTRHISLYFHSQKNLEQLRQSNFELRRKILEMEQLYEVGLAITSLKPQDELLEEILNRAVSILDGRFGAIWLTSGSGSCHLAETFGFNREQDIPSILTDLRDHAIESVSFEKGESLCLLAPMIIREKPMGVLSVAGKESRLGGYMEFNEPDRRLLSSFASQAAVAMDNARLYLEAVEKERMDQELRIAAEIQEAILPDAYPTNNDLDISAMTLPCRTVGGDFFDFFSMSNGQPAMVIADVSGKGVPAAMLVSTFHGVLHTLTGYESSLANMVSRINSLLVTATPDNKFITAAFIIWDTDAGEVVTLSAGHEPMILINSKGQLSTLTGGGMVLGLFEGALYTCQRTRLEPGDMLCLYTDGVTDRIDIEDRRFGVKRLEAALLGADRSTAVSVVQDIFRRLETFAGDVPPPDDQTMMVLIRR